MQRSFQHMLLIENRYTKYPDNREERGLWLSQSWRCRLPHHRGKGQWSSIRWIPVDGMARHYRPFQMMQYATFNWHLAFNVLGGDHQRGTIAARCTQCIPMRRFTHSSIGNHSFEPKKKKKKNTFDCLFCFLSHVRDRSYWLPRTVSMANNHKYWKSEPANGTHRPAMNYSHIKIVRLAK